MPLLERALAWALTTTTTTTTNVELPSTFNHCRDVKKEGEQEKKKERKEQDYALLKTLASSRT